MSGFSDDMATAAGPLIERLGTSVTYKVADAEDQTVTAIVRPEEPEWREREGRRFQRRMREVKFAKSDLTPKLNATVDIGGETWSVDRIVESQAFWKVTVVRPELIQGSRANYREYG